MTVDIIIPCYYSSEIIQPCLEKIMNQTVIKDIIVTIVNDCSPNTECEYQDIIQQYSSQMNIKYLKTEKNSGPGVARQLGLDNATCDWVMFIDQDDELYDNTSVERLLKLADLETVIAVTGQSMHPINGEDNIQPPWIHHHGSIYNRKILKEKNIRYDPRLSYLEEDGAFSRRVIFYGKDYEQRKLYEVVYIKKINHTSITTQPYSFEKHAISAMGLDILELQYTSDALCSKSIIEHAYRQAIIKVSNLLYILQKDDYHLTMTQYQTLLSFIIQFNTIHKRIRVELLQEKYQRIIDFCNSNFAFLGLTFSIDPVINYNNFYLDWLSIIENKIQG